MSVPAHDERDFDFAKKFGLEIIQVVQGRPQESPVQMINSDFLNGLDPKQASEKIGFNKMKSNLTSDGLKDQTAAAIVQLLRRRLLVSMGWESECPLPVIAAIRSVMDQTIDKPN